MQIALVLLLIAPSGLWMAWYAEGGPGTVRGAVAASGFALLAVATGSCRCSAGAAAKQRRFADHRRWMPLLSTVMLGGHSAALWRVGQRDARRWRLELSACGLGKLACAAGGVRNQPADQRSRETPESFRSEVASNRTRSGQQPTCFRMLFEKRPGIATLRAQASWPPCTFEPDKTRPPAFCAASRQNVVNGLQTLRCWRLRFRRRISMVAR